ncbi:unnamed protein product [Camellia sinensis]
MDIFRIHVTVRQDEKMELAKLLDHVPIPIKESLEEPSAKINVLLEAYISQLKLEGLSVTSDMVFITQSVGCLMRALFEIILKREWAQLAEKALNLCKMVTHVQPITHTVLRVALTITPDFQWEDKVHGFVEPFWMVVEDNDGEYILHHEYFLLKKQYVDEDHTLNFSMAWIAVCFTCFFQAPYSARKVSSTDRLIGLTTIACDCIKEYEALFQEFKHFNPVQTQVFTVLYNMDDNVLVAAPIGSAKTICAEFAILRNHQKGSESIMRAVYIAPIEALAKEQYNDWKRKFGEGLGIRVVELTGEMATDLKLLEKCQLIVSTPEKWDALSCHWKQRKHVQQISLFIIDELHLIYGQGGPVLEVIVSRMRYIASQVENKIRIVAFSTSLANAQDLGEWIGAPFHGLFNFPPNVRPVPLEIHIQGIDIANFEARMQVMTKPTYTAIVQHAKIGKPAIVFVPTRKHARLTTVDLMTYSSVDSGEKPMFLLQSAEKLASFISRINEPMLRKTLQYGVGYLHEGLTGTYQDIVKTLFETGWIQVCVMSS